jgi:hypothetical protein
MITYQEMMNDDQWRGYVTGKLETAVTELCALKTLVSTFQDRLFSLRLKLGILSGTVSIVVTLVMLLLAGHLKK